MVKVRLGGFPFRAPISWQEVKPDQARRLHETRPEQIQDRLAILLGIPGTKYARFNAEPLLAVYELVSFIEEIPDLVANTMGAVDIANEWSFVEFETARQVILQHKDELGLALYPIAEIKGQEANYIEYGAKALDGINAFLEQYKIFDLDEDEDDEPSALEEAAGINRLQAFGPYALLEAIAAKFGKYPDEIERKPVGWVYTQYHFDKELGRFQNNYAKLKGAKG